GLLAHRAGGDVAVRGRGRGAEEKEGCPGRGPRVPPARDGPGCGGPTRGGARPDPPPPRRPPGPPARPPRPPPPPPPPAARPPAPRLPRASRAAAGRPGAGPEAPGTPGARPLRPGPAGARLPAAERSGSANRGDPPRRVVAGPGRGWPVPGRGAAAGRL